MTHSAKPDLTSDRRADELIYLVAPAGAPNFGDEYIVSVWLRHLARRRPRSRVILDCHTPGVASLLHASEHPQLTVTNTLWQIAEHAENVTRHENEGQIDANFMTSVAAQLVADAGPHPELVTGANIARSADVIHLVGGGWFNDIWPRHVAVLAAAIAAGHERSVRVATGQGVCPLDAFYPQVMSLLGKCDLVDVRDVESETLLSDYFGGGGDRRGSSSAPATAGTAVADATESAAPQISRTGDDAWGGIEDSDLAYGGLGGGADDARERSFVLCAQGDLLRGDPKRTAEHIRQLLEQLGAIGAELAIVECIPGTDGELWRAIDESSPDFAQGFRYVAFDELWAKGLPVRAGQTWISSRYHPHLIAAAAGARGVALDTHQQNYYSVKHRAVQGTGSQWPIVELDAENHDSAGSRAGDFSDVTAGPGMSESDVLAAQERKRELINQIYPANEVLLATRGIAGRGARGVRDVLRRLGN